MVNNWVYLLKLVIFHGELLDNQRVSIPMTAPWYLHGTWREKRGRCRAVVMTAVEVPRAVDIGLAVGCEPKKILTKHSDLTRKIGI